MKYIFFDPLKEKYRHCVKTTFSASIRFDKVKMIPNTHQFVHAWAILYLVRVYGRTSSNITGIIFSSYFRMEENLKQMNSASIITLSSALV